MQLLRNKNLGKYIFLVFLLSSVLSAISQAYFSNKFAIKSCQLTEYIEKKESLEKDIAKLESEIFALSSLSSIEKKAKDLGFVELENQLSFIESSPVAVVTSR